MTILLWAQKGGPAVFVPVLSSPNAGTPTSNGTTNATVSSTVGNGTLYWCVVTNGGSATNAQIIAGSGGNIVVAGNQAVSVTGTQTVASITGLSSSTLYQIIFLQVSASGGTSSQSSVNLTTASAGDPYWSFVTMLLGNDNAANGSTTFTDQSSSPHTMTAVGDAQYSSAQAATGMTTSMAFDGTGDYLTTPNATNLNFGTGDFVIDLFVRFNTVASDQTLVAKWDATFAWILQFLSAGSLRLFTGDNGVASTGYSFAWSPSANTWYYVAIARSGSNLRAYVNTAQIGTTQTIGAESLTATETSSVATNLNAGAHQFVNGYINSLRISKGTDRGYTGATITVPTLPVPTS